MQELTQSLLQRQSKSIKQKQYIWMRDTRSTIVPNLNKNEQSKYNYYSYIQQNGNFSRKVSLNSFQQVQSDLISRSSSYQTIKNNQQQWQNLQNQEQNLMDQEMRYENNIQFQFQKDDQDIYEEQLNQSHSISQRQSLIFMKRNEEQKPFKKYMRKAILGNHKTVPQSQLKKTLNQRIFYLKSKTQDFLYIMNFFFNTFFRLSLIFIFVYMIINNKNYQLVQFVIIMQLITVLIYIIAMGKLLITKQNKLSIYFQKYFYEKPYIDIHMNRILRKHFTASKLKNNLITFLSPITPFKINTKISLMRQEIYKRAQIMLCFIPFVFIFLFNQNEFYFQDWQFKTFVAIVISVQSIHITIHYLIIYISS